MSSKGYAMKKMATTRPPSQSRATTIRCAYCRSEASMGETREITVNGERRWVHKRHPVRPEEKD